MTTEIFTGTYSGLKDRLDALILAGATALDVVKLNGGVYLIIHS